MADRENGASPEDLAKREHFMRLYSRWLRARAIEHDPDENDDDDAQVRASHHAGEAARDLVTCPAPLAWAVWLKWEVLDLYLHAEGEIIDWPDNRAIVALAAIKADLMRFGIGGGA